jgi:hypothetical protein
LTWNNVNKVFGCEEVVRRRVIPIGLVNSQITFNNGTTLAFCFERSFYKPVYSLFSGSRIEGSVSVNFVPNDSACGFQNGESWYRSSFRLKNNSGAMITVPKEGGDIEGYGWAITILDATLDAGMSQYNLNKSMPASGTCLTVIQFICVL